MLASVALVSFAVLAFEISLTRIYSLLYLYPFVFLAVSGAACGLGLGGFAWHQLVRGGRRTVDPGWLAAAFAALLPLTVAALFGSRVAPGLAAHLWGALLPILPFSLAGAFLAAVFTEHAAYSGRLYQADLAGACLAALGIVPLLDAADPVHVPCVLGAVAAAGTAAWAATRGHRRLLACSAAVAAAALALWPLASSDAALQLAKPDGLPGELAKPMSIALADPAHPGHVVDTEWTAYARTDLVEYAGQSRLQLYTDGDTPAPLDRFDGNLASITKVDELQYLAFALGPHRAMLSLGPGGGLDFLLGKLVGFEQLDGIEINASLVDLVERHRDISGDVYHLPGVSLVVDDGRSAVRRSHEHYDLIVNSLTLANASTNTGPALVESFLYTREAFADYDAHLEPAGRYALIAQSDLAVLRATFTAFEVMRAQGTPAADAWRRLLVLTAKPGATTPYRNVLVWKKAPFSDDELAAVRRLVDAGHAVARYVPGGPSGDATLAAAASGARPVDDFFYGQGLDVAGERVYVRPVTDDRPFFLFLRAGSPPLFDWLLVGALVAAAAYTALALALRRGGTAGQRRALAYFSVLGVSFMLVEIPLAQKFVLFLGRPTSSLALVLFCVLFGASAGSSLAQRWPLAALRRRVAITGALLGAALLAASLGASAILDALLPLPLPARWAATVVLLVPIGVAMGIPFPSGLRLAAPAHRLDVPWFWGINGVLSVVGGALAASGPYYVGFSGCLVVAAVLYAGIGLVCPRAG